MVQHASAIFSFFEADPLDKRRSTFGFGIWKSVYLLPLPTKSAAFTQLVPHTYYAGGHPTTMLTDASHAGFNMTVRAELYAAPSSVGTTGDSYDNALAANSKTSKMPWGQN